MLKKILIITLLICCGFAVHAQQTAQLPVNGDNLTVRVAVMGPGKPLYYWWGHIALIVDDAETDESYFFDYGIFNFNDDNFYKNFAFGRLLYRCARTNTERNINTYIAFNRSITIYTLDLLPEEKARVYSYASINVLPENRNYYYHHFKDNCSTRIRDLIDLGVNGQLKEKSENEISRYTLRQHVRRHTYHSLAEDWFLNYLMGQVIDTPITAWDDMFLPSEVGRQIENFRYTDLNGQTRKLVSSIDDVYMSVDRAPVLDKPRSQWPIQLGISLVLAAIFYSFFFIQAKNFSGKLRWISLTGKALAGASMSLCGLFFGLAAVGLYFMSIFTNHDYTYQNANMIYYTPLLLVSFPMGVLYAAAKKEKKLQKYGELLRIIWLLSVLGLFISMLIKLLPWFYQDNLTDQMLMLPIALVFTCHPAGLKETLKKYFPRKRQ